MLLQRLFVLLNDNNISYHTLTLLFHSLDRSVCQFEFYPFTAPSASFPSEQITRPEFDVSGDLSLNKVTQSVTQNRHALLLKCH